MVVNKKNNPNWKIYGKMLIAIVIIFIVLFAMVQLTYSDGYNKGLDDGFDIGFVNGVYAAFTDFAVLVYEEHEILNLYYSALHYKIDSFRNLSDRFEVGFIFFDFEIDSQLEVDLKGDWTGHGYISNSFALEAQENYFPIGIITNTGYNTIFFKIQSNNEIWIQFELYK